MRNVAEVEYNLNTKEVAEILNESNLFDKTITTNDINKWAKKWEINAQKNESKRWVFKREDVEDFMYRVKHNYITFLPRIDFMLRTRIQVNYETKLEFKAEENLFQLIVSNLITLHPYALYNDPTRKFGDLWRAEGGLVFKNATIVFRTSNIEPKDTVIPFSKTRWYYTVIASETINQLSQIYERTEGHSIKERLINAGWEMVDNKIPHEQYLKEINGIYMGQRWNGFFGR